MFYLGYFYEFLNDNYFASIIENYKPYQVAKYFYKTICVEYIGPFSTRKLALKHYKKYKFSKFKLESLKNNNLNLNLNFEEGVVTVGDFSKRRGE